MKLSHLIILILLCIFSETECILNGDKVKVKDLAKFKYVVAILSDVVGERGYQQCTGGILNDKFILTAAHCFAKRSPSGVIPDHTSIRVSAHSLSNLVEVHDGSIVRQSAKVYMPTAYFTAKYQHDIAILQLRKSLNLVRNFHKLKALKLPQMNFATAGKKAVLAGYGVHEIDHKGEQHADSLLRSMDVEVVPDPTLDELIVLAVSIGGTSPRGMCSGDSGGPLVIKSSRNLGLTKDDIVIATVMSSGDDCDDSKLPAFYIRVSAYLDNFINKVLGNPNIVDSSITVKDLSGVGSCPRP